MKKTALLSMAVIFIIGMGNDVWPSDSLCSAPTEKGGSCWTTEDVIHSEIDHHAQSGLLHMFARGGLAAFEGSAILCAVKEGRLEGIYMPAERVPAMRAESAGSSHWEMIPDGAPSACYTEQPLQGPKREPLIVFRKQIKDNKHILSDALGAAFAECGIAPLGDRCYTATISKPEPPLECRTDQDCVDKELGNRCTEENRCIWEFEPDVVPTPGPTGCLKCNPVAERINGLRVCPAGHECDEQTFCCTKIGAGEDQCVDRMVRQKTKCVKLCDAEGERRFSKCFELEDIWDAAKNPIKTAVKKTVCAARAKIYYDACAKRHYQEMDRKVKECRECSNDNSCESLTLDCTL